MFLETHSISHYLPCCKAAVEVTEILTMLLQAGVAPNELLCQQGCSATKRCSSSRLLTALRGADTNLYIVYFAAFW